MNESSVIHPAELSYEDGVFLVKLARKAIHEYLKSGKRINLPSNTPKHLLKRGAAFVTLETMIGEKFELRGCIGFIKPVLPLARVVIDAAISSATEDPRFPPMSIEELNTVVIEVSILSEPEFIKVKGYDVVNEIEIGKHGLVVQLGVYSGTLLPVVPVEYCWDKETFLAEACVKAGLRPDCWLSPKVKIFKYTSATFKEKSPNGEIIFRDLQKEFSEKCMVRP